MRDAEGLSEVTWGQHVVALLQHDGAVICQNVAGSTGRHAQAPVCADGEAALPFWQVCLEVALELVRGLVVDALPLEGASVPSAPEATTLDVPVHPLHMVPAVRAAFKPPDRQRSIHSSNHSLQCS